MLGLAVPVIALAPFEASAAAKLRFALRAFSAGPVARYNRAHDDQGWSRTSSGLARWRRAGAVLLVTGMSGAGRSTALKTLEDMGYEAFDNLPFSLVPALDRECRGRCPAIAVGADLRTRGFAVESMLETARRGRRPDGPRAEGAVYRL